MKKYKNPILLQSHLDKAKSAKAKEQLIQLEADYQKERKEQEEVFFVQDQNFYQGLKDGLHAQFQEQGYLDYKDDRRLRLQDKYLSEGDKTLEHYHPELFEEIRQQEQLDHQKEDKAAKSLNQGYFLEKQNHQLALKLRENIGDITIREEPIQDFVKGQELSQKERVTVEQNEHKENSLDITRENEPDLDIETSDEPDLDIGDDSRAPNTPTPDNDISLDIDD